MQKAKKLCCRITPRRIMGTILVAASLINLIIVGAAFEVSSSIAVPKIAGDTVIHPATLTFFVPTGTAGVTLSTTWTPTDTATQTVTSTSTDTPTSTLTDTHTPSPTLTACVAQYSWPIYTVQRGDTLYSLAKAIGSSVEELMLANCLPDNRIYVGQPLYVPRLPILIVTTTPSTTPSNTPTVFQNTSACVIPDSADIVFSVTPYDPEGISILTASYQIESSQSGTQIPMGVDGDTYYGSESRSGTDSIGTITYFFTATDNLGSVTHSIEYATLLQSCYLG